MSSFYGNGGGSGEDILAEKIYICGSNEYDSSTGLPTIVDPEEGMFYLVPSGGSDSNNLFNQFIYKNDNWEKFGSGSIDAVTGLQNLVDGSVTGSVRGISTATEDSNYTMGQSAFAEGIGTMASGRAAHAEGVDTIASGVKSHAEGDDTLASGDTSHAEGNFTRASGGSSHAEGNGTQASGYYSHAEGGSTVASGRCTHAEGNNTTASGFAAHASGYYTVASGDGSYTEGNYCNFSNINLTGDANATTYTCSSGIGYLQIDNLYSINNKKVRVINKSNSTVTFDKTLSSVAISNQGYAIFYIQEASGVNSHAEGETTKASGRNAHAEGQRTKASGYAAHVEGQGTTASGGYSHAQGRGGIASGYAAHAEGWSTIASKDYSHAEGYDTTASGQSSHAEGAGTIANHVSQHVFGEYNIADSSSAAVTNRGNYVEIVGNGTDSTRSNARTLDWNGNEVLAGKLTVGTNPENNMDVATKQYVDNNDLSNEAKQALLNCFAHVAWTDGNGQQYYDALSRALFPISSISATFKR